jgi:hypothetical protein
MVVMQLDNISLHVTTSAALSLTHTLNLVQTPALDTYMYCTHTYIHTYIHMQYYMHTCVYHTYYMCTCTVLYVVRLIVHVHNIKFIF